MDRPPDLEDPSLVVYALCSFQWATLSLALGMGFETELDVVPHESRVESVADVGLVLYSFAALFHGLDLLDALAFLKAVVLEARLDGARLELTQVTPAAGHQWRYISPPSAAERFPYLT